MRRRLQPKTRTASVRGQVMTPVRMCSEERKLYLDLIPVRKRLSCATNCRQGCNQYKRRHNTVTKSVIRATPGRRPSAR